MTSRGAIGSFPRSGSPPVVTESAPAKSSERKRLVAVGMDYFAQAFKALSERWSFDTDELVVTLPRGLAGLVLKQGDSRKKNKKSNVDSNVSKKGYAEQDKSSRLWIQFEEWFRELTLLDIEKLYEMYVSLDCLASCSVLTIPLPGNAVTHGKNDFEIKSAELEKRDARNGDGDSGIMMKEDVSENCMQMHHDADALVVEQQPMIANSGFNDVDKKSMDNLTLNGQVGSGHQQLNDSRVEWVLCTKNKILITTTQPTRKRKKLGANAGLERIVVAHPLEGNSTLCHFCGLRDKGDQLNKLIVCHACNMAVHQRCYGIQGDAHPSWLCSWCKWRKDAEVSRVAQTNGSNHQPCVLCPKSGGALKPLSRAGGENSSSVEFAHLFCSQWFPEVLIEDMRMMEPILNVNGIKETRWKLLCYVCKTRNGACIRCSYGVCRASFHPICAREAGYRLEIWGKFGCDVVELRAFCAKHSDLFIATDSIIHGESTDQSTPQSEQQSFLLNRNSQGKVNEKNVNRIRQTIQVSDTCLGKAEAGGTQETGLQNSLFSAHHNLEHVVTRNLIDVDTSLHSKAEDASIHDSINLAPVLKKVIERRKFTLKEVASGTGISKEALATAITVNHLVPDLSCKVAKWLQDRACMAAPHKKSIFELKSSLLLKAETGVCYGSVTTGKASDTLVVRRSSVLPRRRIFSNIRCLEDDQVTMRVKDESKNNDVSTNVLKGKQYSESREALISNGCIKIYVGRTGDSLAEPLPSSNVTGPLKSRNPLCNLPTPYESSEFLKHKAPTASSLHRVGDCDLQALGHCPSYVSSASGSFVIPYIKRFGKSPSPVMKKMGLASGDAGVFPNHQDHPSCGVLNTDKKANETGTLKSCADYEVEGELIYLQHRLLSNVVARKHVCDGLICKIVKNLPEEMSLVRMRLWDNVHLNQCLHELREAKKQGRKERRHEAETVIPPAAAAVASSSKMSLMRNVAGKLQHRAYCDMHSADARAKIGAQKHGAEELKRIQQIRFELERLRLLCERIIKREKLKRELVICSHDILASKRDSVAFWMMLVRRPVFPLEESSQSATTSLNVHGAVSRSSTHAVQTHDDDCKTDGSSTFQCLLTTKRKKMVTFSRKQASHRATVAYGNISKSGETDLKFRKATEILEKELMMTSDQATMKNRRLPRGYIYVPLDCLSNQELVGIESVGIE